MDEQHKIFTIPEVLEVILSYVDMKTRREAASVCKDFYLTICRLKDESKKTLILDEKVSFRLSQVVLQSLKPALSSDHGREDLRVNAAFQPAF